MPDPNRVAYLTQTTLSLDETKDIIAALKQKFPNIKGPAAQDICYATENRQVAVKQVASESDLLLVVGLGKQLKFQSSGRGGAQTGDECSSHRQLQGY